MCDQAEHAEVQVPSSSLGDKVHAVVRAGLGAIPVGGQAAIELFSALVTPPLERRRNEWMREIGEQLAELSNAGRVNLEELQQDEKFIDILMDASQAAIRNANEEKREALRNAIRNAALDHAPEDALQHMFIRWIDELTEWHLRLLKFFQNPVAWAESNGHQFPAFYVGALSSLLESAYPALASKREF